MLTMNKLSGLPESVTECCTGNTMADTSSARRQSNQFDLLLISWRLSTFHVGISSFLSELNKAGHTGDGLCDYWPGLVTQVGGQSL